MGKCQELSGMSTFVPLIDPQFEQDFKHVNILWLAIQRGVKFGEYIGFHNVVLAALDNDWKPQAFLNYEPWVVNTNIRLC